MQNELVTSLSEAFPKHEITSQCENKLIEVYKLLDQCLHQSESVIESKNMLIELIGRMNLLVSSNYLFDTKPKALK